MSKAECSQGKDVWYKSPWLLLALSLLGICIVGNIVAVIVLSKYRPDEVNHAWYRKGLLTHHAKTQSDSVHHHAVQAILKLDTLTGEVFVTLDSAHATKHYKWLTLLLEHPIKAKFDQEVVLKPNGKNKYRGELDSQLLGKRYLLLKPKSNTWQLVKTVVFPTSKPIDMSHIQ